MVTLKQISNYWTQNWLHLKKIIFKGLYRNYTTCHVSKQEKPIVIEEHRNASTQVIHSSEFFPSSAVLRSSAVLSSSLIKSFSNKCTDLRPVDKTSKYLHDLHYNNNL